MTNYTYKLNIPAAPNDPSNDQGPMQTNTNSIQSLIAEDHYAFNDNNGGLHQQARLVVAGSIPARIGKIYTKLSTSTTPSLEPSLFFTPDATGNEYQLTRTITASFPQFSTNGTYGTPPANTIYNGGWTFLPGGMLYQYGTVTITSTNSADNTSIPFPVSFTNPPFIVQCNQISVISSNNSFIYPASSAIDSFKVRARNTAGAPAVTSFSWFAIGI